MDCLKSIRFNKNEFTANFLEDTDVVKLVEWIFDKHEMDKVTIHDNSFTFEYPKLRYLGDIVGNVFTKTSDIRHDRLILECEVGTDMLSFYGGDEHLFKITVFNKWGTIGVMEFGCWQYGKILTFKDLRDGYVVTLRNSNLDKFSHQLVFNDDLEVLIEIGEYGVRNG